MGGAVILNWVLGAIIIVAIIGGGFYAVFRHGKAGPNYRNARRHYQAKDDPSTTPLSDYVPTERVAAAGGLAVTRAPLADPDQENPAARPSGGDAAPDRDPE
jgi:hypothetical protein